MSDSQDQAVRTRDIAHTEAPMSFRSYLICAFASFGGLLFGYDSGYINGVLGMAYVKRTMGHAIPITHDNPGGYALTSSQRSLIVSILSAGTFFGALIGGQVAEWIGRRITIMISCFIFAIGVAIQVAATSANTLVGGRLVAGLGVGGVSAVVIVYVSEIAPRQVRGLLVSMYQFCITLGLLVAACIAEGTQDLNNRNSYRIPIALQLIWAAILALGLFLLPESPRYLIKIGKPEAALKALSRVRGQSPDSPYLEAELAEVQANYDYEMRISSTSWFDCFRGGLRSSSNLRRVLIGTSLQMFQQWTGVNFIFYYGTTFFQQSGIRNAFLITIIINVVNVCSTPLSFYTIERFGRRSLLIYGAILMLICEFIIAIVGTAASNSDAASKVLIAFVCVYIFAFASTWGPTAWVLIGELFPLPIRAKGVALSTASNWFWNCIIGVVTPYMVDADQGNLGSKVFFVWGSTCVLCLLFAYFCVPETKGLSLEEVDRMMEETTPRTSMRWIPHSTYAHEAGLFSQGGVAPQPTVVANGREAEHEKDNGGLIAGERV